MTNYEKYYDALKDCDYESNKMFGLTIEEHLVPCDALDCEKCSFNNPQLSLPEWDCTSVDDLEYNNNCEELMVRWLFSQARKNL